MVICKKHSKRLLKNLVILEYYRIYLGYNTGSNNYKIQDMNGYVHDPSKKSADFLIDLYVETAIELFFMAPHGTVQKYTADGAKIGYSEYEGTETQEIINLIQMMHFSL